MANNEDGRLGVFLLDAIHSSFEDYPPVWPMDVLYIIISSQWNDSHIRANQTVMILDSTNQLMASD